MARGGGGLWLGEDSFGGGRAKENAGRARSKRARRLAALQQRR